MTLPALVVLLVVVGAVETLLVRCRRRRGDTELRQRVAQAGFESLGTALAPGERHKREHDESQQLHRDEVGDGAPPRTRVNLDTGVARVVLTDRGHATDA